MFVSHDTRLDQKTVESSFTSKGDYLAGYWAGVICCRSDPGVRAMYVRYDEEIDGPVFRPFSYDELVATAWLIARGVNHRLAALLVHKEHVMALEDGAPNEHLCEEYEFESVILNGGVRWLIACGDPAEVDLTYLQDYACWGIQGGQHIDFSEPGPRPEICPGCEACGEAEGATKH